MATYTQNLNLIMPDGTDEALISDINSNMDTIDDAVGAIADGLAIVSNNNTHAAITSGQFVYVRNHGSLAEGLYVATANISANATLSGSNLTADANGVLNVLNNDLKGTLQDRGSLNSSNNMNSLSGNGFWRIVDTLPQNAPSNFAWSFVIQVVIGALTHQYIFRPSSNSLYIREYSGSPQAWSSWRPIGGFVDPVRINYGNNSYVDYWKSGQTACVYVHYNVTDGTLASWTSKTIATVPEGFRPVQIVQARGEMDRATDEGAWAGVTSSGAVQIGTKYNSFASSGGMLNAYVTYPIRY